MSLKRLGWNSYFDALWQERERAEWLPARVISQQRGLWRISGDFAECWAEPSGTLRAAAETGGDWPAVGDWVGAEKLSGGGRPLIHNVLPRRTKFVRKVAGRRLEEQVIAANVDTAFVVMALDNDFNVRRLERYLAQGSVAVEAASQSSCRIGVVGRAADAVGAAIAALPKDLRYVTPPFATDWNAPTL